MRIKLMLTHLTIACSVLSACAATDNESGNDTGSGGGTGMGGASETTGATGGVAATGGSMSSTGGAGLGTGGIVTAPPRVHSCADSVPSATLDNPMIDDLEVMTGETPDKNIAKVDGRLGYWYVYNDKTGTQTPNDASALFPTEGGAPETTVGADSKSHHIAMAGEGFSSWGAAIALFLNNDFQNTCLYDASSFDGIQFYARGTGTFRFGVSTSGTQSQNDGGTCDPTIGQCGDQFSTEIVLTETWQLYQVPWTSLQQGGWGQPAEFSAEELIGLAWQTADTTPFNIDIDELGFFGSGIGAGGDSGQ